MAQTPAPSPAAPCSPDELKAAIEAMKAAVAEAKAEAKALRVEALERENVAQRVLLNSAQQEVAAGKKNTAALVVVYEEAQTGTRAQLAAQKELIASLTAERDALRRKIEDANNRFMCEAFKLLCIH
jgi:DNA-binding response OmpR family regulator